jgi:phytoene desaturase
MPAAHSVVIIGAGPGGLAAALLLAKSGVRVTILEKQPYVGGRCSAIKQDGFRFDLGPTFFLYPTVLQRIFRLIGRDLFRDIPMTRLDPQYRVVFGDRGHLDCTPDLDRMEREVAKLSEADAKNVKKFILDNRHKLERFRPALESPFRGLADLLSWDLVSMLPILRPWKSVDSELKSYFQDERTRLAFSFQSKYLGMSPFNCPSLFSILSYLEYDFGVWHPTGGCSAVSDGMARIAREMGVEIRLGEPVKELIYQGKRAIGAVTAAGEYRADAVVMNADFANAMQTLVPNERRAKWTDIKLAKKKYSCSTFMLYLGLDGPPPALPHHTIYTSKEYVQNLHDIETGHVLSADPSVYVQNPGVTDATMAPAGKTALYILSPVSHCHESIDWNRQAAGFREQVLDRVERLGVPDLRKRIRFEKQITPNDWRDSYDVYRGATFNLAHNLGQMLHLRPRNRFDDIPGVYLVGGGTHPGSGLPVIYESARISCRLLLEELGRDTVWLGKPGAKDEPPAVAV